MFFWKAEGTFIKDFNKECVDTKNFIDSVLQFGFKFNTQQERGYNRDILNIQALNHNSIFEDISSKEELKIDEMPHINFTKAMNDSYQKKFRLKNWIYKK
jgi:hypothetical protein